MTTANTDRRSRWSRFGRGSRQAVAAARRRETRVIGSPAVVAHVVGVVGSVHAATTTRTAQGAIAWAVSLNTFPYVVADRPFAPEMEWMLRSDMVRSVPFDPAGLETMPFHRKLAVRAARLLSPIL